mmetsp:Transcript_2749/g.6802  ORF Transcript_2749/g.6802 Transcript_2749/m.6802 type:complete len:225 (-) Transcript_2749:90-764(-)|eukprot:CAMPEP_0183393670 /NCGR_PEP_ID=MMETSP0370-20130417/8076_1 /TAXON_ID=268820 /ORGANISM="Peridinium aciculiferum, Strain PAER-2" /LENGTH=224 /DNA_ID=CAMNT_0025573921 /DNA_START=96 /DNA_END=770 /DNA_ORIENTATION=+
MRGSAHTALLAHVLPLCGVLGQTLGASKRYVGWGIVGDVPRGDTEEYRSLVRTDYRFRIQEDYVRYSIDIRINPCKDEIIAAGMGIACCSGTSIAGCQHHPEVDGGPDLQVAYFQNAHIPNCKGTPFEADHNCGTFLEVHRLGDRKILADMGIDQIDFPSGYQTTRLAIHRLCVGDHELWWVVRTPSGPWVKKIRKFFVRSPSCSGPAGLAPPPEAGLPRPAIP